MPLALTLSDAANLAAIFSTLITLVATVIGAVWVVHTWRRQERLRTENEILQTRLRKGKEALDERYRKEEEDLRQQKENPGLEIQFACQQHPLPDGRILLTLDYAVRNTGVIPIFPDITKASYSIGEIPLDSVSGFLTRSVSVEGKVEIPCAPGLGRLRLEQKTETMFTAQYLAAPGHLYGVTFKLPSKDLDENGQPWIWSKWRALFVPSPAPDKNEDEIGINEDAKPFHRLSGSR